MMNFQMNPASLRPDENVTENVTMWNKLRQFNPSIKPNLRGASLHGENLSGADLSNADLSQANLRGASLHGANLHGASLRVANLSEADLSNADLSNADLFKANCSGANLSEADLRGANLFKTNFSEADLRKAKNVDRKQIETVVLGADAPANVRPGEEFTVRFVAYLQKYEEHIDKLLKESSQRSKSHLGIEWCRWKESAYVTVILSCHHLNIAEPQKEFQWNSPYRIIYFDVVAQKTAPETTIVLKFEVYIEGFQVASLRFDLQICNTVMAIIRSLWESISIFRQIYFDQRTYKIRQVIPATTAFASYASQDRSRVLDRVDALQISAGMDIFQDCLSLHPGNPWKEKLLQEIVDRDIFLLFWSKYAKASQWVEWEWTTALEMRGEEVLQLHPLDTVIEAPPPPELAHLHFESPIMVFRKSCEGNIMVFRKSCEGNFHQAHHWQIPEVQQLPDSEVMELFRPDIAQDQEELFSRLSRAIVSAIRSIIPW